MTLEDVRTVALPACQQYAVKRLEAFGSLARGTADASSDVDLLVEFHDPTQRLARRFFGLLHYLEDHLGREVDLLTASSLRNPYFKARVEKEKVLLYEG